MYAEYAILYDESVVTSMQSLMSRSICLLVRYFECGEFVSGMRNLELSVSLFPLFGLGPHQLAGQRGIQTAKLEFELTVIAFLLVRRDSLRCRHASCTLLTIQMLFELVSGVWLRIRSSFLFLLSNSGYLLDLPSLFVCH